MCHVAMVLVIVLPCLLINLINTIRYNAPPVNDSDY